MKKIIPFEKELVFKTKVCEITAISLEHKYKMEDDDLVTGNFIISGEYKMTEGSINREKFEYIIPFDIALDSRYDTNNIVVDIDDFNYSIVNNDILKVKITLYIEGDLIKAEEVPLKEVKEEKAVIKEEEPEIINSIIYNKKEEKELKEEVREANEDEEKEVELNVENVNMNNNINDGISEVKNSLFDNLDSGETYSTYHVYIVKEDDTIDKIMTKYNVSKDDLADYNDLSDIKPGDKVIIPTPLNG